MILMPSPWRRRWTNILQKQRTPWITSKPRFSTLEATFPKLAHVVAQRVDDLSTHDDELKVSVSSTQCDASIPTSCGYALSAMKIDILTKHFNELETSIGTITLQLE